MYYKFKKIVLFHFAEKWQENNYIILWKEENKISSTENNEMKINH